MDREVVRDFLNLPGIAGVALMDGRSRPYFCGVDQSLNFQQKEALVQGIRQVVETTPDDFESFEFQFTGYQVYIYKLAQGTILLVLARSTLIQGDYRLAIDRLKVSLQADITKAISTFRLIASDLSLSNQNYWKGRPDLGGTTSSINGISSGFAPGNFETRNLAEQNGTGMVGADPGADPGKTVPSPPPKPPAPNSDELESTVIQIDLREILAALNQLSQFTTQYLGTAVITNYWKSSRPKQEWMENFQVDRSAKITFASPNASGVRQPITPEQHQWVRDWVTAFTKRCSQVIRDFPSIVDQNALNERQKSLLL